MHIFESVNFCSSIFSNFILVLMNFYQLFRKDSKEKNQKVYHDEQIQTGQFKEKNQKVYHDEQIQTGQYKEKNQKVYHDEQKDSIQNRIRNIM